MGPGYKHTIKSKKFKECEYRFGDPLGETQIQQVFKFMLCGISNGNRKSNYVGYQISYLYLMPQEDGGADPNNESSPTLLEERKDTLTSNSPQVAGGAAQVSDYANWKALKRELAALE